jgi:hypothetical protein
MNKNPQIANHILDNVLCESCFNDEWKFSPLVLDVVYQAVTKYNINVSNYVSFCDNENMLIISVKDIFKIPPYDIYCISLCWKEIANKKDVCLQIYNSVVGISWSPPFSDNGFSTLHEAVQTYYKVYQEVCNIMDIKL